MPYCVLAYYDLNYSNNKKKSRHIKLVNIFYRLLSISCIAAKL